MMLIGDTSLFSLSHLYHTLSQIPVSFSEEIYEPICRINGLIFSKLTIFFRVHPDVGRMNIRVFILPTSGCTSGKTGMEDAFSALFWQKRFLSLDVKVCISDVNIGKNNVYSSLYAGIPSKKA